jgi:hypothetical protein
MAEPQINILWSGTRCSYLQYECGITKYNMQQLLKLTKAANNLSWKPSSHASVIREATIARNVSTYIPSFLENDVPCHDALRFFSSARDYHLAHLDNDTKESLAKEREHIIAEAKKLTLSLYRNCTRSVRTIRYGNDHDRKEFEKREQKRLMEAIKPHDPRLGMISMLPPVDPEEELRSRAGYYQEYARENFFQESDCLRWEDWEPEHIQRYVRFLRRGEQMRQWLLTQMRFEDPRKGKFPTSQVDAFEQGAQDHVRRARDFRMRKKLSPEEFEHYLEKMYPKVTDVTVQGDDIDDDEEEDDDDEDLTTDEEDDSKPGLPSWYKNP